MSDPEIHLERAREILDRLRAGDCRNATAYLIYAVREELARGGLSLVNAGSSEAELKVLAATCHRNNAAALLEYVRRGSNRLDIEYFIAEMRKALTAAGSTLDDLGTSDVELAGLVSERHRFAAAEALECLRRSTTRLSLQYWFDEVYRRLKAAGMTAEAIGVTDEELNSNLTGG